MTMNWTLNTQQIDETRTPANSFATKHLMVTLTNERGVGVGAPVTIDLRHGHVYVGQPMYASGIRPTFETTCDIKHAIQMQIAK